MAVLALAFGSARPAGKPAFLAALTAAFGSLLPVILVVATVLLVLVILRLVSRIFKPMENRRIKKIEHGNIRKAVNT